MELRDGRVVFVRPLTGADRDRLAQGFADLSEESRYQRFFAPVSRLSTRQLDYLTGMDHHNHFAWGVQSADSDGIGIARYVRTGADTAEAAFTIADRFQHIGLGWLLLRALALVAWENDIKVLEMDMLADNNAMAALARKAGSRFEPPSGGTMHAELAIDPALWADLEQAEALRRLAAAVAPAA